MDFQLYITTVTKEDENVGVGSTFLFLIQTSGHKKKIIFGYVFPYLF